jgi:hypothetical protein
VDGHVWWAAQMYVQTHHYALPSQAKPPSSSRVGVGGLQAAPLPWRTCFEARRAARSVSTDQPRGRPTGIADGRGQRGGGGRQSHAERRRWQARRGGSTPRRVSLARGPQRSAAPATSSSMRRRVLAHPEDLDACIVTCIPQCALVFVSVRLVFVLLGSTHYIGVCTHAQVEKCLSSPLVLS